MIHPVLCGCYDPSSSLASASGAMFQLTVCLASGRAWRAQIEPGATVRSLKLEAQKWLGGDQQLVISFKEWRVTKMACNTQDLQTAKIAIPTTVCRNGSSFCVIQCRTFERLGVWTSCGRDLAQNSDQSKCSF